MAEKRNDVATIELCPTCGSEQPKLRLKSGALASLLEVAVQRDEAESELEKATQALRMADLKLGVADGLVTKLQAEKVERDDVIKVVDMALKATTSQRDQMKLERDSFLEQITALHREKDALKAEVAALKPPAPPVEIP